MTSLERRRKRKKKSIAGQFYDIMYKASVKDTI